MMSQISEIYRTVLNPYRFLRNMEILLDNHLFFNFDNTFCKGQGTITGIVRVKGVLSQRRVSLFERQSMKLVKTIESDAVTGAYEFDKISGENQYVVLVDDDEQIYNAAVADWVKIDD